MNLRMIFLLVFLNHCCAEEHFKNNFILITDIALRIFRRSEDWLRPFDLNNQELSNVCEQFRNLPKFQINKIFLDDSNFEEWTNDYEILFRETNNSEMIHIHRENLYVNDDVTIKYALLCSWGKSIVYITKNKNIRIGYVLFIRNQNAGLKVLGVTAQFVPMKISTNSDDISERMKTLFETRDGREELKRSWNSVVFSTLIMEHRLVWELCASIFWQLVLENYAEKNVKLKCSYEYETVCPIKYSREWKESRKFYILKIESKSFPYFQYDVYFKPQSYLYVYEKSTGVFSLCELPFDMNIITYRLTLSRGIGDNVYDDNEWTRIRQ